MKKRTLNGKPFVEVINEEIVASLIAKLAQQIKNCYEHDPAPLVYLFVINGGSYVGVDLCRASYDIGLEPIDDTIGVSRYKNNGDGILRKRPLFTKRPRTQLKGCNVVVIDDLQEEGKTMEIINNFLLPKKCMSIAYCVLVTKIGFKGPSFPVKFVGKRNVPKNWLTGNGMDSWGKYRGLRSIYQKLN